MARVLVVDDEPVVGRVIAEILRREGYEADIAGRADEGFQRFRESGFNLAIIDIRLPDMDGLEMAIQLHAEFPERRIIIMSGGTEPRDKQYCQMAMTNGVNDVISKPFSREQLIQAVSGTLN